MNKSYHFSGTSALLSSCFVSAYEGAASDSFDDLAHLGVAEAKQDESSALVPEKW